MNDGTDLPPTRVGPRRPPQNRSVRGATRPPRSRSRSPKTERSTRTPVVPADRNARLITFGAFVLSVGALIAVFAGVFTVHSVQVVGAGANAEAVMSAADLTGRNIFRIRTDQVVARLAAVPAVEVDRVETSFPDRVTVYTHLRQPRIAWRTASGTYLVDQYGVAFSPVQTTTLPVVSGGSQPPTPSQVAAVQYATTTIPRAPGGQITGFELDPGTGLAINGQAGWKAVVGKGDAQTLVRRVASLSALLDRLAKRGKHFTFADLRFPDPYFRSSGS